MITRRRWLAFSLRSLFVVLTGFAVWLGIAVNRARDQREAARAIRAIGGGVHYEWEPGSNYRSFDAQTLQQVRWGKHFCDRHWLGRFVGDDLVHNIDSVVLRGSKSKLRRKPGTNVVYADYETTVPRIDLDWHVTQIIPHLQRLPRLSQVLIEVSPAKDAPQFSDAALHELRRALPRCQIKRVVPKLEVSRSEPE